MPDLKEIKFKTVAKDAEGNKITLHEVTRWMDRSSNFYAPNPTCWARPPVPVFQDPVVIEIEVDDYDIRGLGFERKKKEASTAR